MANGEIVDCEIVPPVKILVRPSFLGDEPTSSLRRGSVDSREFPGIHGLGANHENHHAFLVANEVNQSGNRERRAELSIEIDHERKNAAYYLQHCFRLMYYTEMSTYSPDKKENGKEETWMQVILNGLQKVIFWTIALLSLGYSILLAKVRWVIFLADTGVFRLVYFGSSLYSMVSDIYFMYLFAYRHNRIKEASEALDEQGLYSIEEVGGQRWNCRQPRKLITVMFVFTIIACIMTPLGSPGISEWSHEKLVLDSSKYLSSKLFIWNPNAFEKNSTKLDDLKEAYGTHLTPLTVAMAYSEIGMQFCSNMKMDTAQNMGVVVAVLIWLRNRYFGKKLKSIDFKNYTDEDNIQELDSPEGILAEFKQRKKENRLMNGLTGGLLKIVHAYNLLQCANFLMRCLDGSASLPQFVFLVYCLVKVAAIYYFGKRAEAQNEKYEEWIREWADHSKHPVFLARLLVILDGMKKQPLGVGRGEFLVGHGFIFRFINFVGSIFMMEVAYDEED